MNARHRRVASLVGFVLLSSAALFAPLFVGALSSVTLVGDAFKAPAASSVASENRAQTATAPANDSLERALSGLDSKTIGALFARWNGKPVQVSAPRSSAFLPSPFVSGIGNIASAPILPITQFGRNVLFSFLKVSKAPDSIFPETASPVRVVASRVLRVDSSFDEAQSNAQLLAFLRGWSARQSLARADDALLERRALNQRIALLARAPVPTLDLSLVPPDVQLELTNLRLQLLPMLSVSGAQRARSQARIDEIEARLKAIWEAETARQAQLQRQTLEVIPAQHAREGEKALATLIHNQARLDQNARDQVGSSQSAPRARLFALTLRQNAALSPETARVAAQLRAPFVAPQDDASANLPPLNTDQAPLFRFQAPSVARFDRARRLEAQVWKQATR